MARDHVASRVHEREGRESAESLLLQQTVVLAVLNTRRDVQEHDVGAAPFLETFDFDIGTGVPLKRTCSVGFAFYPFIVDPPDACSWEQVVDLADHCLYAAKRGGRNAWVGIGPAEDFTVEELPKHLPSEVPRLVQESRLNIQTSLPPGQKLEWDLHE